VCWMFGCSLKLLTSINSLICEDCPGLCRQRNNLRLYDYSLGNYTVAVAVHTLWNTFFMHGCSDFFAKYICDFYHQELGTCFSL